MNESISKIRVRYVETDQMGVVHHSVYLHWMEIGRSDFLRMRGLSYAQLESMGIRMPVIEVWVKYFNPAKYDEEILIKTSLKECDRIKFTFEYEILKDEEKILVKGMTKHVATDNNNKPKRIPYEILKIIGGEIV